MGKDPRGRQASGRRPTSTPHLRRLCTARRHSGPPKAFKIRNARNVFLSCMLARWPSGGQCTLIGRH
eukprot:8111284-Lingulodinium_polyedra.AAC.1